MPRIFKIEMLFYLLLLGLLSVSATPIARWHRTLKGPQQEVRSFDESATSMSSILESLSSQFHIPIGFEAYPGDQPASIRVKVESGTVYDVLDEIIRSDPRYIWVKSDGMVDVIPSEKDVRNPILDMIVTNFQVSRIDKYRVSELVTELPEIKVRIEELGLYRHELKSYPSDLPEADPILFSLQLQQAPLRVILNEITKASSSKIWAFAEYDDRNKYFSIRIR